MKLALLFSSACVLLLGHIADGSPPQILDELTYIENRPADDVFGFPGLYLVLRVDVTDADGVGNLTGPPAGATATSNNNSFPFANPVTLSGFNVDPPNVFFISLLSVTPAEFSDVSGRYTYRVTDNDLHTDTLLSHLLNRMEVVPLPTNLSVSDQSLTPTFSFTDPDPTPHVSGLSRGYQLWILDGDLRTVALIPPAGSVQASPVMAIPAGLLCPCVTYHFRAQSWDIDTAEGKAENMGNAFLTFTPTAVLHNGDINKDCKIDGRDIQPFINSLVGHSTQPLDLCSCDFSGDGQIDPGDVAPFVSHLLSGT